MQLELKSFVYYTNEFGWIDPSLAGSPVPGERGVASLLPQPNSAGAIVFDRYEGELIVEGDVISASSTAFNLNMYRQNKDGSFQFIRFERIWQSGYLLGKEYADQVLASRRY